MGWGRRGSKKEPRRPVLAQSQRPLFAKQKRPLHLIILPKSKHLVLLRVRIADPLHQSAIFIASNRKGNLADLS